MLKAQQIAKYFGFRPVLSEINLEITAGDKIFLHGPNGSGKTTLLRTLSGFMKPNAGNVFFEGTDIWEDVDTYRSQVGVLFEDAYLYPDVSLINNLRFFSRLYRVTEVEDKIRHWVQFFSMEALVNSPARYFSKGERQKASLIRSLIHEPKLLIWDEPTTGLDVSSKLLLKGLIEKSAGAIVFSSHESFFEETQIHQKWEMKSGHLSRQA